MCKKPNKKNKKSQTSTTTTLSHNQVKSSSYTLLYLQNERGPTHTRKDYHVTGQGCPRSPHPLSDGTADPLPPPARSHVLTPPQRAPVPPCGQTGLLGRRPRALRGPWRHPDLKAVSSLGNVRGLRGSAVLDVKAEGGPGRHGARSNRPARRRSCAHLGWRMAKHDVSGMARHSCSGHALPAHTYKILCTGTTWVTWVGHWQFSFSPPS